MQTPVQINQWMIILHWYLLVILHREEKMAYREQQRSVNGIYIFYPIYGGSFYNGYIISFFPL